MKPNLDETEIYNNRDLILGGSLLVIDPSSGSKTSNCGFAYYRDGELVESGIVPINKSGSIITRLDDLYNYLRSRFYQVDVMIMERIRGSRSHIRLLWAAGVCVPAVCPSVLIEMNISTWRKRIPKDYVKGDVQDAEMMGETALAIAEECTEDEYI